MIVRKNIKASSPTQSPSGSEKNIEKFQSLLNIVTTKIKSLAQDLPGVDNVATDESAQMALQSQENVLKITHEIKSAVGPLTTSRTASLHIQEYDADLSIIKINLFRKSGIHPDLRNINIITFVYKNTEAREHFFVKNNLALTKEINNLLELANTMQLAEFSLLKGMIQECEKRTKDVDYWEKNWEDESTIGLYYDKINDPLVTRAFIQQVLLPLKKEEKDKPLIILDVGAGKGRLADKLITVALKMNVSVHYLFVEPNEGQINTARERLQKYEDSEKCRVEFIQSTLADLDLNNKAHCIISSGGTINMDVVTRNTAISNIQKLGELLHANGFLIATGQTAILIKAKYFKSAGFNVLSYAAPFDIPKEHQSHPFLRETKAKSGFFDNAQRYVCRKVEETKHSKSKLAEIGIVFTG